MQACLVRLSAAIFCCVQCRPMVFSCADTCSSYKVVFCIASDGMGFWSLMIDISASDVPVQHCDIPSHAHSCGTQGHVGASVQEPVFNSKQDHEFFGNLSTRLPPCPGSAVSDSLSLHSSRGNMQHLLLPKLSLYAVHLHVAHAFRGARHKTDARISWSPAKRYHSSYTSKQWLSKDCISPMQRS